MTDRTQISRALPLNPGQQRRVERIALAAVPALAHAPMPSFVARGFFHDLLILSIRVPSCPFVVKKIRTHAGPAQNNRDQLTVGPSALSPGFTLSIPLFEMCWK
ncbi:MAG: hypothetical protein JWM35_1298 [Verrucomicrobia bacterium]|nr:hypothetical protein [Verrucomicrobiota bacterium]